jgi:membrane-bound lytic murein transglycosylase D
MKILRIFGIVLAVHAFAFILIFANPGCSTKPQPTPTPADTASAAGGGASAITVPAATESSPITVAQLGPNPAASAVLFDPNAPAAPAASPLIRYSPTRPSTAAAVALQAEPVPDVVPATTITVTKGDNLWNLAKKYNLKVSDLATANNLKTGAILREDQRLIIPSKSGAVTAADLAPAPAGKKPSASRTATAKTAETPKPAASPDAVKHVVKHGETLGGIAAQYKVSKGELAVANNINDPKMIREGQVLVIPGYVVPGARSTKAGKSAGAAPASAPAAPAPAVPVIGSPTIGPGSDTGSAPSAPGNVPVIKIDDSAPVTPPKS